VRFYFSLAGFSHLHLAGSSTGVGLRFSGILPPQSGSANLENIAGVENFRD
jgi:hypothetical protein